MKKLLWIGDAAAGSGFGKASRYILDHLRREYEIGVLGINFRGDPPYPPYPVYPASAGGDILGFRRVGEVLNYVKPDVIVVQTNPWNVPQYRQALDTAKCLDKPVIGIIAVEGKNCNGHDLNSLQRVIFWNEFSRMEAIRGGLLAQSGIVPLGVDLDVYSPGDRQEARQQLGLFNNPSFTGDPFIVCNINRNQSRKRLDLSIMYFAEWIHGGVPIGQRSPATRRIDDAFLYLHAVAGSTIRLDCDQLANYCGVIDRLILVEPKNVFAGTPEKGVVWGHRASNVGLSTSLGEGWGLNTMEGMACERAQIGGDYAAFGDWARDGMYLVPCPVEGVMPDVQNMVGGIPDKAAVIAALEAFYHDPALCQEYGRQGRTLVEQPQYRWENLAQRFAEEIAEGARK